MQKTDSEFRKTGRLILLTVFFIFFMLPLSTYSAFSQELQLNTVTVLVALFLTATGLILILTFALRRAPVTVLKYVEIFLMLLALIFAYNYYMGDYGGQVIGADADVFENDYSVYELVAFFAVIAAFTLGYNRLRPFFENISILLILTACANFVPLFASEAHSKVDASVNPLRDRNFLDFSTDLNVIHIVLDGMQGTQFSQMLKSDSSIPDKFSGFTFFPDALTSSDYTYLSFASVLSGNEWDGVGSIKKYRMDSGSANPPGDGNIKTRSFLDTLSEKQFLVQALVNPGSRVERRDIYDEYISVDVFDNGNTESAAYQRLLDLTLIKVMPWQIKRVVFRDGDWLFSQNSEGQLPRANSALKFIEQYSNRITATHDQPTYKLLHILSPHGPWTTGEDCSVVPAHRGIDAPYAQARCTILGLAKLMDGLKRIEVYDKSLIVIHGDHGICDPRGLPPQKKENVNIPYCVGNTNPLLMIKPPFDSNPFRTSTNFVALTDIAPTILDQLSIEHEYKGANVFNDEETQSRTRYFYAFQPNRVIVGKQDKADGTIRYAVKGPIKELASWCVSTSKDCPMTAEP